MSYRIAEAAELVGVPPTTLRYYEDIGLLGPAARAGNGYRVYDDRDLDRLRFVTAVKSLGIPLTDVRELVRASEVEDCSTVAHQVVELVADRLAGTQERIAELVALAAQLQTVSARLAGAPAGTACGPGCPCATAATEPLDQQRTLVPLTRAARPATGRLTDERTLGPLTRAVRPAAEPCTDPRTPDLCTGTAPTASAASAAAPVIACSLNGEAVPERVARWQALVARAVRREAVDGGVALLFGPDPGLAGALADLAAAEQACCTFFDFAVRISGGRVRLEVRAPADATDLVAAMFGTPD